MSRDERSPHRSPRSGGALSTDSSVGALLLFTFLALIANLLVLMP